MNKCVFILPYFGKFNNYFPLFLRSCGKNSKFNWLIFTDDKTEYIYPPNVKVHYCSFDEIKNMFEKKFDFEISLLEPYNLCDFKPSYGYVFQEYIAEYEYWGFCDCDLIFGNLNELLFPILEQKIYDKIFNIGHLSVFRNNLEINTMFMSNNYSCVSYKNVFSSPDFFGFDELEINHIFENEKKTVFPFDISANISVYHYDFRIVHKDYSVNRYITEDKINGVFLWNDGNIERYSFNEDDNLFEKREFTYIHLQQRKMNINCDIENDSMIQIVPNAFLSIRQDVTVENFNKIKKMKFNLESYIKCSKNNFYWKIKRLISRLCNRSFTRAKI